MRQTLRYILLLFILTPLTTVSAQPLISYSYQDVGSGYIQCPNTLLYPPNSGEHQVFCEASAIAYFPKSRKLIMAADWWGSRYHYPFMAIDWNDNAPKENAIQLKPSTRHFDIEKVEDMSQNKNRRFTMATASFSHTPESYQQKWQQISRIVYWQGDSPKDIKIPNLFHSGEVIEATESNYHTISDILRSSIKSAIQEEYPGIEFFKIEGLAFLPENRVAFGIREIGQSHSAPQYVSILVTTSYSEYHDTIILNTDFKMSFDLEQIPASHNIHENIGISSLEFDFNTNRLYMTTSYEQEELGRSFEQVGAYLWVMHYIPDSGLYSDPIPVVDNNGLPLRFSHKVEGITLDNKGQLILVSDDDKLTGTVTYEFPGEPSGTLKSFSSYRKPDQARYNVIRLIEVD